MPNKTQLQSNNEKLSQLIETLNNKTAGSDNENVKTCTVTVNFATTGGRMIAATTYVDGAISNFTRTEYNSDVTSVIIENVVCGSTFSCMEISSPFFHTSGDAMNYINGIDGIFMFSAPTNAGASASITLYVD